MATARVTIPYRPRDVFTPLHDAGERYGVIVAHRRAGKTVACINELLKAALTCTKKNPRFAYVAPHYNQAKDIAWEYLKEYAAPVLEYGGQVNESELRVDLPNGGRVRLYGADNYNRLRGLYFDGIVLDEYADMDPRIWEVVRPALSDREGWCIWIGTPKGHNAFYDLWQRANKEDDWFALELRASKTAILNDKELEDAKRELTADQYAQEYECSFEAAILGAYYGEEMKAAEADGRITRVAYDRALEVHTAWDLGIGDSTAIWFCQMVNNEIRVIDYLEGSGVGLDWYAKQLKDKPYAYGQHILPHDVEVKELGTGKSRKEILEGLGIKVEVAPKLPVDDGIQSARLMLNRCWFDRENTERGVEALKQYRREYDEKNKAFKVRPLHDWTSHAADAFRYLAVGLQKKRQVIDVPINVDWVA